MTDANEIKPIARNRKARHEYFVEDTIEAGIELLGSEIKSLRAAAVNLSDAYATVEGGQMFLLQMQISEYPQANHWNHEVKRTRRLLLHRREIDKLAQAVRERGYTLLPLEIYLKNGRAKVLLGLCKGKHLYDKREAARERDEKREVDREMSRRK